MTKCLVVVESPAKARTINKYLGKGYTVKASLGHVLDLPKSQLGVDEENDFEPTLTVLPKKKKILEELKKAAKKVDEIYLATDPDREGEAIGAHLARELGGDNKPMFRVMLHEITKKGVRKAFENPSQIVQPKVDAQLARRILDRLMGYKISPLLWDKVRRGLSAGRVQSVALRIICDRETVRDAFKTEEYWTLGADLESGSPPPFQAKLHQIDGKKAKVSNQEESDQIVADTENGEFKVTKVVAKEKKRHPVPPFITSKLQQDASRRLGFSVKKTMTLAQRLYEGKDLGDRGTVGLITYMRTDSTRVSDDAIASVREYVESTYGADYLPKKPNIYRSKKSAQDAHEAIRPTVFDLPPAAVKKFVSADELKLYTLIWTRFVASQMASAIFDTTTVNIEVDRYMFRAAGSVTKFIGFLKVYQDKVPAKNQEDEDTPSPAEENQEADGSLPQLTEGEILNLKKLDPVQHFTQPPPRFNEASLVKELEECGIGRPSTYASILATLTNREYVTKEKGRFFPTELGKLVTELLVKSFGDLIDVEYTAKMEEQLDAIEEGKLPWVELLRGFHVKFIKDLERAKTEMRNVKTEEIATDQKCTKCEKPMVIKWGRYGQFLACSGYPDCRNTCDLTRDGDGKPEPAPEVNAKCEKCDKDMVVRKGRYGQFLACSGYPDCKTTRKLQVSESGELSAVEEILLDEKCPRCKEQLLIKQGRFGPFTACSQYPTCRYIKLKETGVKCPKDKGMIVERKSRRGKTFFGCDQYPDCDFVLWYHPVDRECPECDVKILVEKTTKRDGHVIFCPEKPCKFKESVEESEAASS